MFLFFNPSFYHFFGLLSLLLIVHECLARVLGRSLALPSITYLTQMYHKPHPQPLPHKEGSGMLFLLFFKTKEHKNAVSVTHHSPPYGGGVGGGACVSVSAMPPCPLLFIIIPLPPNQNQ